MRKQPGELFLAKWCAAAVPQAISAEHACPFARIAGYLGIVVKNLYQKHVNDSTKKAVVKTCVQAVEQLYQDLHGEDKYNKVVESVNDMLNEKGITITDIEMKMLIEAAVGEFNKVFEDTDKPKDEATNNIVAL